MLFLGSYFAKLHLHYRKGPKWGNKHVWHRIERICPRKSRMRRIWSSSQSNN
jgi:hypothetical protein